MKTQIKLTQTDPNRMATITARYERLISANQIKDYIRLCPERYLKVLLAIKKEYTQLMRQNEAFVNNRHTYKFKVGRIHLAPTLS